MALPAKALVTECFADTGAVAIFLYREPGELNKQHGVGNVARVMKEPKYNSRLGFIDGDRSRNLKNPFISQFNRIADWNNELILLEHPATRQQLIMVEPAIERFLLNAAASAGITANEFPCLASLNAMKDLCKDQELWKNQTFKNLVKAINRAQPAGVVTLQTWIKQAMNWP